MATAYAYDWKNIVKNSEEYQSNVQAVNDYFYGQQKELQTDADYDISSAYANYRKNQLNVMNSASLTEGFKELYSSDLESAYKDTEKSINEQLQSNLATSYSNQASALSDLEEAADEQGQNYYDFEELLKQYSGENYGNFADDYQYYDSIYDETTGTIKQAMTQDYKDRLAQALYGGAPSVDGETKATFAETLAESNQEMYEWYMNNQAGINKYLLGVPETTNNMTDYYTSEYGEKASTAKQEAIDKYGAENVDTSKEFANAKEEYNYYTNTEPFEIRSIFKTLSNTDIRVYHTDLKFDSLLGTGVISPVTGKQVPYYLNRSIHVSALGLKNSDFNKGDIIKYNNSLYVYTGKNSRLYKLTVSPENFFGDAAQYMTDAKK